MPSEYRVRWRRASWEPTTMSVRLYQRRALAEAFVSKLELSGEFETVELDRRKVGRWERRSLSGNPIEVQNPHSGSLSEPHPPASPKGSDVSGEIVDAPVSEPRIAAENDGYMSNVGAIAFPNPEIDWRRWW